MVAVHGSSSAIISRVAESDQTGISDEAAVVGLIIYR
jgi:hypothetical protein